MKRPTKKGSGLPEEKPLPQGFSARSDFDTGSVTISKGKESVSIGMGSYASVANLLHELWPDPAPSLAPGATLMISDGFSGKSTSVLVSALSDAAAVLKAFVVKGDEPAAVAPAKAKVPSKKAAPPEPPAAVAGIQQEEGKASVVTRKRAKKPAAAPSRSKASAAPKEEPKRETAPPAAAKPATGKPAAKATPAAKPKSPAKPKPAASAKPASKATAKSMPAQETPAWFAAFKKHLEADDGSGGVAELVKCGLVMDPERVNHVRGKAKDDREATGWGYEVLSGGKHVAWVIAADHDKLIVTDVVGDPEYVPSKHKQMAGVMARLTAIVMPKFFARAA